MFKQKHEDLINKLAEIREQLKQAEKDVQSRKLKKGEAAAIVTKLSRKRDKIEAKLLELIVETEETFQNEAWFGFRKGLVASLKSMEKMAEESVVHVKLPPQENKVKGDAEKLEKGPQSLLSSFYAKIASHPKVGWVTTAFLVYMLLIAVDCLSGGFKMASGGSEGVKQLFAFADNPFAGLVVGILATALIQSSSTTTSIIVGLCAAGLPVEAAIPMVMGANIGTSVTNTLVSMGHIGHKTEFQRAFAAATIHDFFNLLAVAIFLPLELCFGFLEKSSHVVAEFLTGTGGIDIEKFNFIKAMTSPVSGAIKHCFELIPGGNLVSGGFFILFGIVLIFSSIVMLGKLLRLMLIGKAEEVFNRSVGGNPITSICAGLAITVLVQSSSTTTSLIVPLAGAGVMTLHQVYPFTLGANIGTCITALIAALAIQTGSEFALQIAFVHLFFNLFAVLVIYTIPFLRNIPIILSRYLARIAVKQKSMAFMYVVIIFFVLPVVCIGISRALTSEKELHTCPVCGYVEGTEIGAGDETAQVVETTTEVEEAKATN